MIHFHLLAGYGTVWDKKIGIFYDRWFNRGEGEGRGQERKSRKKERERGRGQGSKMVTDRFLRHPDHADIINFVDESRKGPSCPEGDQGRYYHIVLSVTLMTHLCGFA